MRLWQDIWPLDHSTIGPNLVASLIWALIVGLAVYLVYPHLRRAVDGWMRAHLHDHRVKMDEHLADIHAKLDALHRKVDDQSDSS